ncbi:Serine/threonine-protein kinase 38 [Tritrichomonas musculus]|uniref:non-specific serine/threonine protein kinase n=1 Tax=Tritrichomonas musculus TaxID=1915356 RepID=A0ABR2IMV3_9EUKA
MSVIRRPAMLSYNIPAHQYSHNQMDPTPQMMLRAQTVSNVLEESIMKTTIENEENNKAFQKVLSCEDLPPPQKAEKIEELKQSLRNYTRILRTKTNPGMFVKHALIGKSEFSRVFLVTDKTDHNFYAMKVMPKTKIIENGLVSNIMCERKILSSILTNNERIVNMYASFQDQVNIYYLLEYIPGGDLRHLMRTISSNTKVIQFIIGELILDLEAIHNSNIVHLDVKPENILMKSDGHLKISDFGISEILDDNSQEDIDSKLNFPNNADEDISNKRMINEILLQQRGKTASKMSTLEYMAPEVYTSSKRKRNISFKADLWSVGIILYELFYGEVPFPREVIVREFFETKTDFSKKYLYFPSSSTRFVPSSAISLIRELLKPVDKRPSIDEVKNSPFFKGFNFDEPSLNIPPLVPSISAPFDLSHFTCEDMFDLSDVPQIENSGWAQLAFLGFTYRKRPDSLNL